MKNGGMKRRSQFDSSLPMRVLIPPFLHSSSPSLVASACPISSAVFHRSSRFFAIALLTVRTRSSGASARCRRNPESVPAGASGAPRFRSRGGTGGRPARHSKSRQPTE